MNNRLTVKDIRTKNKFNVLYSIINSDGITRNELAKKTNVSLMTITNVVDELLEANYIYEVKIESSIGRTPSNLYIDEKKGLFLCVDLTSTTKIDYILYNIKKKIFFSDTVNSEERDYVANIEHAISIIKKAINKFDVNILGIGLAVPGAYIPESDTIRTSLIKEHQQFNFKKIFAEAFKCKNIFIGHDVNMAAKAELNGLSADSSLFYIYIGEGVGGTYVKSGEVVKGIDLLAGDIGQAVVCYDNKEVTIEEIISLPSIEKNCKAILGDISVNELIRKYLDDDAKSVGYLKGLLNVMSNEIYNLTWLFNSDYIVVSSSNKQLARLIIDYANKLIENRKANSKMKSASFINTKIIPSFYSENPALIGVLSEVITYYIAQCAE